MRKSYDLNCIVITDAVRNDLKMVRSKHQLFSEKQIVFEIKDDCIFFRLPYFDEEKVTSVNHIGKGWYRFFISCDIPNGTYNFEDNSTEDVKVIYYGK